MDITEPTEEESQLCILCKENKLELSMSCSAMHSYCFVCIKKWTNSLLSNENEELTCPECRKVTLVFIKRQYNKENISTDFENFLKAVDIIPIYSETEKCNSIFNNTCIYPSWSLINFIKNEKQLKLYYSNVSDYPDESELNDLIKWHDIETTSTDPITHKKKKERIEWENDDEDDDDDDNGEDDNGEDVPMNFMVRLPN